LSLLAYGDVSEVVDRLNAKMTTLASPAQVAWTKDPMDEFEHNVPTVLVYPAAQFSSQTRDSPVCRQEIQLSVVCLTVCEIDGLGVVLKDQRDALLGWQVAPEYSIMKLTHQNIPYGLPLDIKGKYIWWEDTYQVEYLHRTI